jgi:hypothetical protein
MVEEIKVMQSEGGGADQQQIEAQKLKIEAMRVKVEKAQVQIEEARQLLACATSQISNLEQALEQTNLEKFNKTKCSLTYCLHLKKTPREGTGKAGTCVHHCNLIAAITYRLRITQGVASAGVAFEYLSNNEIDADLLRRAQVCKEPQAVKARAEYLERVKS